MQTVSGEGQYTPVFLDYEGNRIVAGVDTYLKETEAEAREVGRQAILFCLLGNFRYNGEVIRISKKFVVVPRRLKLVDVPIQIISGPLYERAVKRVEQEEVLPSLREALK
ncbi:MAG: hypothetical protein M0P14_06995 [Alkaliphilus sp.]|nr:hypothetical protein [Alkaliphilus sp.]